LIYNKKRISVFLFRKKLILGGKKGKVVEIKKDKTLEKLPAFIA